MIVSIAMAVLPVWRSPMISSRCPRPIGIIASIALRPVCRGSFTGWRKITPGALRSSGISASSPPISPSPSRGLPSGSTTLPSICSDTRMDAIRFVRETFIPSEMSSLLPSRMAPTLSSSRFIATAISPFSNSSSSPASQEARPWILTTPSLTCSTVPTSSH